MLLKVTMKVNRDQGQSPLTFIISSDKYICLFTTKTELERHENG